MIDPQAQALNDTIKEINPDIYKVLSKRGKGAFFPKKGILSQTADAQHCETNATIGSAYEEDGSIMSLDSIAKNISLARKDVFSYAKGPGDPAIRKRWKEMMYKKNPSLAGTSISNPVVTSALTHGLSMCGYLFLDPDDSIIVPEPFWGNYKLIFTNTWEAKLTSFPAFTSENTFNVQGLKQKLNESPVGKKIIILNFPNNPTGYTPLVEEAEAIKSVLIESAEAGNSLAVITDDAYFGLVYEEHALKESIFSYCANAHERILAVKLDGPTKEDYVWGFRIGFMTFSSKRNAPELYQALENKLAGAIRGTISNASHPSQSLLLHAYEDENYKNEKNEKVEILKNRYLKVRSTLENHPEYEKVFKSLPFNSGYFMCVRLKEGINADQVRKTLIEKYSTGVITTGDLVRVAFSSTPIDQIEALFNNLFQVAQEMI